MAAKNSAPLRLARCCIEDTPGVERRAGVLFGCKPLGAGLVFLVRRQRHLLRSLPSVINVYMHVLLNHSADAASAAPLKPAVRGCTCFKLRRLTRRVTQHYDAHLLPLGLRTTQFSLLNAALQRGPIALTALASLMDMDRTTLTRNLQPLLRDKRIEIVVGEDARMRRVQITEKGKRLLAAAKPVWRQAQERLQAQLGHDHVAALHALIDESLLSLREAE
jgi:DNA-binding MarR family transcriptional regulator